MNKTLRLVLAMSILSFLFGCQTAPTGGANASTGVVQGMLDRIVPADFSGDAHFEERGQYVTLVIDAGNLHRTPEGRWSWSWLQYERTLNVPLFAGLPYKQTALVKL